MNFLELLEHDVLDYVLWEGGAFGPVRLAFTKLMLMVLVSAAALAITLPALARRWPLVPGGARNALDAFVVFLRDRVILNNTGVEGRPYLPFFLTMFFFILTANLLGLTPFFSFFHGSSAATANISVTAALALCTFTLIHVAGVRRFGLAGHIKNFIPHGVPLWLAPLILPLELFGLVTRSFALAIRLFANMLGGHIVILSFISLIFIFSSFAVAPLSVGFSGALLALKIFVAFLQAYIFTLLSAVFVGASLRPH